jgi:hypothetical protein
LIMPQVVINPNVDREWLIEYIQCNHISLHELFMNKSLDIAFSRRILI